VEGFLQLPCFNYQDFVLRQPLSATLGALLTSRCVARYALRYCTCSGCAYDGIVHSSAQVCSLPYFVCREVFVSLSVVLLTRLYRVIRSDAPTDGTEGDTGGALGTEEDDGFYDAAALGTDGKNSKGKRGKGNKRNKENQQRPPKRRPVTVAEQVR
jgi:hypothetical protein